MKIRVRRLSGDNVTCELPSAICPEAAILVDAAANEIATEFVIRRRAKESSGALAKWLRPLAYHFISICLDGDVQHLLYRRSLKSSHYRRGSWQDPNPFQLGLMAIFAEDEYAIKEDRYELGQVLWYAYRHYVPVCFINGFASQVGQLTKGQSKNDLEPEFFDWIVERRLMDLRSYNPRGPYPDHVERKVKELRAESGGVLAPFFQALAEHDGGDHD